MSDLPAGPELDRLIAEKFLPKGEWFISSPRSDCVVVRGGIPWQPSTNIAHAWEVAQRIIVNRFDDKMRLAIIPAENGKWAALLVFELSNDEGYFERNRDDAVIADTAPLAICRAALKAVQA